MKNVKMASILSVLIITVLYMATSFIKMDLNPKHWEIEVRVFLTFLTIWGVAMVWVFKNEFK